MESPLCVFLGIYTWVSLLLCLYNFHFLLSPQFPFFPLFIFVAHFVHQQFFVTTKFPFTYVCFVSLQVHTKVSAVSTTPFHYYYFFVFTLSCACVRAMRFSGGITHMRAKRRTCMCFCARINFLFSVAHCINNNYCTTRHSGGAREIKRRDACNLGPGKWQLPLSLCLSGNAIIINKIAICIPADRCACWEPNKFIFTRGNFNNAALNMNCESCAGAVQKRNLDSCNWIIMQSVWRTLFFFSLWRESALGP